MFMADATELAVVSMHTTIIFLIVLIQYVVPLPGTTRERDSLQPPVTRVSSDRRRAEVSGPKLLARRTHNASRSFG